jgi:protein-S-isoprenylcysteine O-methyltransferase Ste14
MSKPLSEPTERFLQRLMDLGERTFIILLFAAYVVRIAHSLPTHPSNLLAVASETLVVLFMVTRRPAAVVSTRPWDWFVAVLGTALPLLVRPGGTPFLPQAAAVGTGLMAAGLLFSTWAKLILRRSFGLAAANRGVVRSGPYRFVRHPMYLGYIITNIGFLVVNPSAWNAGVYAVVIACHVTRILAEERVLTQDAAYAGLTTEVRWRLVPGLF